MREQKPPNIFYIIFIIVSTTFLSPLVAQTAATPTLRVGLAGASPFIVKDSGQVSGISLQVWDAVAKAENWNYHTMVYKNIPALLLALKMGEIDVAVGPIKITSNRLQQMDFSQPYYFTGESILSQKTEPTISQRIAPFFSRRLLHAVLIFIFILGVVGTLFWIAERKRSPEQFPRDARRGIANGMWLAIVTMSTTGYGDRAPITFWGRLIAGCWMVLSLIFAGSMIAGIASTLTLTGLGEEPLTTAAQLKNKKVASPAIRQISSLLVKEHAIPVKTASLYKAFRLLQEKKVDAVIYDRPQLLYWQQNHPEAKVTVGSSIFNSAGYGFAFPIGSPLTNQVNVRLVNLSELGEIHDIVNTWFQDKTRE